MTDLLLEHYLLTTEARAVPPVWPKEWGLTAKVPDVAHNAPLPKAKGIITTFTAAEKQSLAALSPGCPADSWRFYTHNYESVFAPHFTNRSPAKAAGRLGEYCVVTINGEDWILFHSQAHPSTDDDTMPLRALWRQIITESECEYAIDTGTAGAVGEDVVEGDVLITNTCQINCQGLLKDQPYAHQRFTGAWTPSLSTADVAQWQELVDVNAHLLSSVADRPPKLWLDGSDESTEIFAFADPEDSYGVVKADPDARMEEMDLMALVLAIDDLGTSAPKWCSVRCASDPEVPQMSSLEAEKKWAANIYQRFGGDAALGSVEACAITAASL